MRIYHLIVFLICNAVALADAFANRDASAIADAPQANQHELVQVIKRGSTINPVTDSTATFTMPNLVPTSKVSITSQSSGTQRATTAFQKATTTVQSSAVEMKTTASSGAAAGTGIAIRVAPVIGAVAMLLGPF